MSSPIWYPSPNFDAQAAHLLGGMVAIFSAEAMFPRHIRRALWYFLLAIFIKEFVVDITIELDTFAESLKDFLFYTVGAVGAYMILLLFGRGGLYDRA